MLCFHRRLNTLLFVAAALVLQSILSPLAFSAIEGRPGETPEERDARMAWWREARFGMFIHWGVYAVPAGTYNGKQIPGIGEWIMNRGKIPTTWPFRLSAPSARAPIDPAPPPP